jgi:hypothetical protein
MMHMNHASLLAALAVCVLMLSSASSWANAPPTGTPDVACGKRARARLD